MFSRVGYPNAKLLEVAKACGASKSMLYHYFPAKDDLLFALLSEHLEQTIADIEQLRTDAPPEQRFRQFIEAYTRKSSQSRMRHIVAMNDVKYLPMPQQKQIVALERRLLVLFEEALTALDPTLPDRLVSPYSLLLLGMLNWIDLWYRPRGPIKPAELCDRISHLFLHGFLDWKNSPPSLDQASRAPAVPVG